MDEEKKITDVGTEYRLERLETDVLKLQKKMKKMKRSLDLTTNIALQPDASIKDSLMRDVWNEIEEVRKKDEDMRLTSELFKKVCPIPIEKLNSGVRCPFCNRFITFDMRFVMRFMIAGRSHINHEDDEDITVSKACGECGYEITLTTDDFVVS